MISTGTTNLEPPRPEDGTLLDPNPYRRAARLRSAGVAIEHTAVFSFLVCFPDGRIDRRRTYASAERHAHRYADHPLHVVR